MGEKEIRARVRKFLSGHLRASDFDDGEDFFARGYANSLFAMQLVAFVENEFSIRLAPEDMQMENFRSVDSLVHLIGAKSAAAV